MDKYFELQYWLTIISICIVVLIIAIGVIKFIVECIIDSYRRKSKKWQYDCVLNRWVKKKNID